MNELYLISNINSYLVEDNNLSSMNQIKTKEKEENLLSSESLRQEVFGENLQRYFKLRNRNKSPLNVKLDGGNCLGLIHLFACYCFTDRWEEFFNKKRKCISIDIERQCDKNLHLKTFRMLTADELELEEMTDQIIFFTESAKHVFKN